MKLKTILIITVIFTIIFLAMKGCDNSKSINGKSYEPYGLFNSDEVRSDSVHYTISTSSVVLGIIFSETFIIPVYLVGWDLWEPQMSMQQYRELKARRQ